MAKITPSLRSDSELLDPLNSSIKVDAICGLTHVSWDNSPAFTPVGQLVFFSELFVWEWKLDRAISTQVVFLYLNCLVLLIQWLQKIGHFLRFRQYDERM